MIMNEKEKEKATGFSVARLSLQLFRQENLPLAPNS